MNKAFQKMRFVILLLFLAFGFHGALTLCTGTQVQAATAGFKTENGITYYIKSNGSKQTGWLTLNGKKYYFLSNGALRKGWTTIGGKKYYFGNFSDPMKCYMATGWRQDSQKNRRYFGTDGVMVTGWAEISGIKYYFDKTTGIMRKGWIKIGNTRYYLNSSTGALVKNLLIKYNKNGYYRYVDPNGKMVRGWRNFSPTLVRYFISAKSDASRDGKMAVGFNIISKKKYYFRGSNGSRATGWLTNATSGNRYYLDPEDNGAAVVNTTKTIDGVKYKFNASGVAAVIETPAGPGTASASGTRTIRNYLLQALQPVGQALYVWGGGWNDSTRKGVSPSWKAWYDSQSSSYDYNYYRDLSTENRAKGLDCSGFVGWACYQALHTKSGEGYGYTVVSGEIGSSYSSWGFGNIITQAKLADTDWRVYPGDVGYNDGHTWIILGQCADKSAVIVHSTPQAGCQIAGTPTPSGDYTSQAIALAEKYMSRYSGYSKYDYHTSSGNYIRNGNYLRWNRSTLADPDGYLTKSADQILLDIFGF